MSVMEKFGVSAAEVAALPSLGAAKYLPVVPGRVAHIDADFMAYQVSAESAAELDVNDPTPRKTLEEMRKNAYSASDHIRKLARAERAVLHTTHASDKGGRGAVAIQKPYQAQRSERENRPEHLDVIRVWLGSGVGCTAGVFEGCNHTDQEADDGMAQAHYADPENAIVCSMDKDLLMVPGWKLDMYNSDITHDSDAFGDVWLAEKVSASGKKTKKATGHGTKFFWLQCLMGDTADNIQGLPLCPAYEALEASPTAAWVKARDRAKHAEQGPKMVAANNALDKLCEKPKLCGQVLAVELLKDCHTDEECFKKVVACFVNLVEVHDYQFQHWSTTAHVTPTQALLSDMRLLWMRRYKDRDDVLVWLKGVLGR
jgi:hypothetical protein